MVRSDVFPIQIVPFKDGHVSFSGVYHLIISEKFTPLQPSDSHLPKFISICFSFEIAQPKPSVATVTRS